MAGTLLPYPRLRAFNAAGLPVPGARLYSYRAGTQQLADTFTTSALNVAHQNPQIADAAGEFRALYMDPESGYSYKFVCQTSAGAQLWAEDNVPAAPGTVGLQGPPGSAGNPGLSVAELSIYQRAASAPATPSGGSFDFGTQTLDPPADWSVTIPADSSIVRSVSRMLGSSSTIRTRAASVMGVLRRCPRRVRHAQWCNARASRRSARARRRSNRSAVHARTG